MALRFRIRPGEEADLGVLEAMLHEAANWDPTRWRPPLDQTLGNPRLARYVEGWGRPGDAATIAVASSGYCIGAAWYRLFAAAEPGFGFIDEDTPELAIGVVQHYRGRGVGTALLDALIERAGGEGHRALSLSVAVVNPAHHLYVRRGFEAMKERDGFYTMRLALPR